MRESRTFIVNDNDIVGHGGLEVVGAARLDNGALGRFICLVGELISVLGKYCSNFLLKSSITRPAKKPLNNLYARQAVLLVRKQLDQGGLHSG